MGVVQLILVIKLFQSQSGTMVSEESKAEVKPKLETEKPKDKSKPVSSTPVSGSPWCVVWTGDSKQFFYNPSKRLSVWELPDDLKVQ